MLSRVVAVVRGWFDLDDPDERIDGSGEVFLDPAYNGRYAAERNLQRWGDLEDADEERTRQP